MNKEKSVDLEIKNNLEEKEYIKKDQISINKHSNQKYIYVNKYKHPFSQKQHFKEKLTEEKNFNNREYLWESDKNKNEKEFIDYKQFKSISENNTQNNFDDIHSNKNLESRNNLIKDQVSNSLKEADVKINIKSNELQYNLGLIKPIVYNSIPNAWPDYYLPNSRGWNINILNENNRYLNPLESRMIFNKNPLYNKLQEINCLSNYQKFNLNTNVKPINNLFPNFNINNRFPLNSIIYNYYNNLNAFQSQVKLNKVENIHLKHPSVDLFNNDNNKNNNSNYNSNKNESNSVLKISNNINIPLDDTKKLLKDISYKKTDLNKYGNIDKKTIENHTKKENFINNEIIESSIKMQKESIKINSNFSPYDLNIKEKNDKNRILADKFLGVKRNKENFSKDKINKLNHENNKKIKNS